MENALWGLVGVLAGSILTAFLQLISTRMQLKHQSEESHRNHLIEARKLDLIPLRDALAEWVSYDKKVLGHYVPLKEDDSLKQDPAFRAQLTQEFREVFHKESEANDRLDVAMNHVGDQELITRIRQLQDYKVEQTGNIYRMHMKLIDPSTPATAKLSIIPTEYHPIRRKIDEFLVSINTRIEQLLSGVI